MLLLPLPAIVAPVPEYAHVYDVAPGTTATEYASPLVFSQTVVAPPIAPGVAGMSSIVMDNELLVAAPLTI
jgi:hypothetical protein